MKILIAVKSYRDMEQRGAHEQIRESWGRLFPWRSVVNSKEVNMDLRFFVGGGEQLAAYADEVHLNARDDYRGLSEKANEILRWALDKGYDYVVLVDTDTFLNPHELTRLPWGEFDYAGMLLSWGPFMFGGCGFAISRDAALIVLNNSIKDEMDDISIGKILLHRPQPDIRVLPCIWDRRVGWHFPKSTYSVSSYDPRFPWMKMMAQAHLGFPAMSYRWSQMIGGAVREITLVLSRMDRESI